MKQIYCPTLPEKTQQKLKTWYTSTCYIGISTIIVLIGVTLHLIRHKALYATQRATLIQKTQTAPLPTSLLKQLTAASIDIEHMPPARILHLISTTQPPRTLLQTITATSTSWDIEGAADTKESVHLFIKQLSKKIHAHATCSLKKLTAHDTYVFFIVHLDI